MSQPDFQAMTHDELRQYVLTHRDDNEAFYTYMDKLREVPGIQITSEEQFSQLVEQKLREQAKKAEGMNVKQMIIDEMESLPDGALLEVLSHLRIVKARLDKFGY
ncbi:hypothetical protein G7B40_039040 [Aetokthonos hydrillicola Thurmond2011]|jgi:histidyl-tRNA synthetase|uniref:Uncharacterized protein n=1 Tax=Aetokthonos hydrillicola Thurmond2011 TaxID=2712845 RepID=A0AAP5M9T7_9CYAN|nr:hypothetical protein [Aetokthonos hydrillicola]MBW4591301.1 hypothetical protein [Aetokthonos hydrillicola CCALA 1050]MDR9900501.1 hypothetical protein [Aetokthonos hydrillicola Thurmond2011]